MKIKHLALAIFFYFISAFCASAQNAEGIRFINFENWNEVLKAAKIEGKIIFVDAFATWCGPCRQMDAEVYPDQKVGEFFNSNFLSIRIQFDKTKNDTHFIQNWYYDADSLLQRHQITAYPTLLFFSPEGKLIERIAGFQGIDKLLNLAQLAKSPANGYGGKIERFKDGKIFPKDLLELAIQAKDYKQDSIALIIAKNYKFDFIDKSLPDSILNPDLHRFLGNFYDIFSLEDKLVQFIYKNIELSDKLMSDKGYSRIFTDYLIYRDIIEPEITSNNVKLDVKPNWSKLERKIAKSFDIITAQRVVLRGKIDWFNRRKDWPNIVKWNIKKIEADGIDTIGIENTVGVNNMVWNIVFKHSNNRKYLKKGIQLMQVILKTNPNEHAWLDTYANVLYKLGRRSTALLYEKKAILALDELKGDSEVLQKFKFDLKHDYEINLEKMLKKQPTWPSETQ